MFSSFWMGGGDEGTEMGLERQRAQLDKIRTWIIDWRGFPHSESPNKALMKYDPIIHSAPKKRLYFYPFIEVLHHEMRVALLKLNVALGGGYVGDTKTCLSMNRCEPINPIMISSYIMVILCQGHYFPQAMLGTFKKCISEIVCMLINHVTSAWYGQQNIIGCLKRTLTQIVSYPDSWIGLEFIY